MRSTDSRMGARSSAVARSAASVIVPTPMAARRSSTSRQSSRTGPVGLPSASGGSWTTNVPPPRPRTEVRCPDCTSVVMAWRRVEREIPSCSASSRSEGRRSPGPRMPRRIAVPRRSTVSSNVVGRLDRLEDGGHSGVARHGRTVHLCATYDGRMVSWPAWSAVARLNSAPWPPRHVNSTASASRSSPSARRSASTSAPRRRSGCTTAPATCSPAASPPPTSCASRGRSTSSTATGRGCGTSTATRCTTSTTASGRWSRATRTRPSARPSASATSAARISPRRPRTRSWWARSSRAAGTSIAGATRTPARSRRWTRSASRAPTPSATP